MDLSPTLLLWIPVLLFALSFHEFAHAWAAKKGGDQTAEHEGRLTLNPVSHIDPIGTIIVPALLFVSGKALFGWARPVPYKEINLRKPGWVVWVALAGPASNLIIILVTVMVMKIALLFGGDDLRKTFIDAFETPPTGLAGTLCYLVWVTIQLNLLLVLFNALPIPPLDGSTLVYHYFIRGTANENISIMWGFLNQYGFILIFLLLRLPGFEDVLSSSYVESLLPILRFLLT